MAQESPNACCISTSQPILSEGNTEDGAAQMVTPPITFIAKFGKEKIVLSDLPLWTTLSSVKQLLQMHTCILPSRQKLIGLVLNNTVAGSSSSASRKVQDDVCLSDLKVKKGGSIECILVGTPEEKIFVDPANREDLPDVIDDFELDFTAESEQWERHVANQDNLQASIASTAIHIMNQPRPGYPLLVLDLDHTLLEFSSSALMQTSGDTAQQHIERMKRPYMDQFLTRVHRHYDMVVWSQTSWRWLETKLIELGMLSNPGYRFCFVLDKTSMFPVTSTKKSTPQVSFTHHVKPLQLIWSRFTCWRTQNTIHVDDLTRNFALNLDNGLRVTPYRRKKVRAHTRDVELEALSIYLERLADEAREQFHLVDFSIWMDVVSGTKDLTVKK